MQTIGMMSLKNNGGFVVRLEFEYYHEASSKWTHAGGTGDITLGFTKQANPGDHGVPDGSLVRLHAFVVWGKDRVSNEMFVYQKGNANMAKFAISGTTLNNHMEYRGVESALRLRDAAGADPDEINPDALFNYSSLTSEEIEEVKDCLENPITGQNGTWGPLSWNVAFHLDPNDIKKSSVDVMISVLTFNIIDAHLDINNPKATADLSVGGIGVVAELGVDFNKRMVYLKGKLNFVFYSKSFNLTIMSF